MMKKIKWLLCVGLGVIILSSLVIDNSSILSYRIMGAVITISIVLFIWGIMAFYLIKSEPKVKNENMAKVYKEVSCEEISKFGIKYEEFKKIIYQKFIEIYMAFNDFNYEVLKKKLTDDLYKAYVIELNDLKKKNKKIVNNDIELVNIKIYNIYELYGLLHIDVYLNVRMIDYVMDMDNDKLVSGNMIDKMDFEFELNFVKKMDTDNNDYLLSKKTCVNKMKIEKLNDK